MKKYLSLLFILMSLNAYSITKKEIYDLLVRNNIKCKEIVFKQIILESGHLTSKRSISHKNILGMKRKGKYCKYKTYSACIKDYKKRVQSKCRKSETYYQFLKRIGYAKDKNYIYKLKRIKSWSRAQKK